MLATTEVSLAGKRILVAEDESLIALELEDTLQELGCRIVGPIVRVQDVLRAAQDGEIDGALLDINLRGEQIFPILPELMRLGFPIIITSGYDDPTLFPEEFRQLPRIAKPVDPRALRRLCLEIFGRR
jgi:DNA-binding NtrC family response regulator